MIHYALRCGGGHEFDGWFKSSVSFDSQAGAGLLECPVCASSEVRRALMAPRISPRAAPPAQAIEPAPPVTASAAPAKPAEAAQTQAAMPDQMRAVLQRIRTEVEARCDYVGPHFASEVRRMADRTQPVRPVYGEATAEEEAALADEGIEVARIPWVPRADS
jgi:hypothetical protein